MSLSVDERVWVKDRWDDLWEATVVRVQEDGLVEVAYDEGGYIDVGNVVPQASVLNLQMYRAATGQEDPEATESDGEGEAEVEADTGESGSASLAMAKATFSALFSALPASEVDAFRTHVLRTMDSGESGDSGESEHELTPEGVARFPDGAQIEADYGEGGKYYKGTVLATRFTAGGWAYDIRYEDDDTEESVPEALVRPGMTAVRSYTPRPEGAPPPPAAFTDLTDLMPPGALAELDNYLASHAVLERDEYDPFTAKGKKYGNAIELCDRDTSTWCGDAFVALTPDDDFKNCRAHRGDPKVRDTPTAL
jgi:hypothetical protein